ncbi:MAG: hypothetical protein HZB24_02575 [Desulfobacterales bacterium]|nr:hypothetical protein [Desulfobacterales bacterium]
MNRYRAAFLFAGCVIALPCTFLLAVNLYHARLIGIVLFGGLLMIWWALYWKLRQKKRYAFPLSLAVVLLLWLPLLAQTVRRLSFVIENGALEGPGGLGSPLAFLSGLFMEQLFFIPLSVVIASAMVGLAKGDLNLWPRRRKISGP